MPSFYYVKLCTVCKQHYSVKEITEEHFNILSNNGNIKIIIEGNKHIAEISSVCEEHAAEYYKNTQ